MNSRNGLYVNINSLGLSEKIEYSMLLGEWRWRIFTQFLSG